MEHVKDLLSAYLDRELPKPELLRVEAHVSGCSECRAELAELRSVSRLVQDMPREPLPAGFLARLQARRGTAGSPRRFLLPLPARVAAFALSSLVVMFVVYDRIKIMLPASSGMPGMPSGAALDLRLEPPPSEKAAPPARPALGAASPERKALARAGGEPLLADSGAAGGWTLAESDKAVYTNEELHKGLEAQKARMGIRKIVPPQAGRFPAAKLAAAERAGDRFESQMLYKSPPAAALAGNTPVMLANPAYGPAGMPVAKEAADGISQGVPREVAMVLVRSEGERAEVWQKRGMRLAPPSADYSRKMLLILFAQDKGSAVEIADVKLLSDKVLVRFRQLSLPAEASQEKSVPSYQFRVIPKTDLPVVLEKLPFKSPPSRGID